MKRIVMLALAASTLLACGKRVGPTAPAWVSPQACQQSLPAAVPYTTGAPLGTASDVVILVRDGKEITGYVVSPAQGKVGQAVILQPGDVVDLSNPIGDRIAGGLITRPSNPPPPPPGQERVKYLVTLASHLAQTAPARCGG